MENSIALWQCIFFYIGHIGMHTINIQPPVRSPDMCFLSTRIITLGGIIWKEGLSDVFKHIDCAVSISIPKFRKYLFRKFVCNYLHNREITNIVILSYFCPVCYHITSGTAKCENAGSHGSSLSHICYSRDNEQQHYNSCKSIITVIIVCLRLL